MGGTSTQRYGVRPWVARLGGRLQLKRRSPRQVATLKQLARFVVFFALAGATGCSSVDGPSLGRPTDWSISPTSVNLTVGSADTLTVVVWAGPGDTLDPTVGGWEIRVANWCLAGRPSCGAVAITLLAGPNNPRQYRLNGLRPTADTLFFQLGYRQGCPDPPLCSGAAWTSQLPSIGVPVTVR